MSDRPPATPADSRDPAAERRLERWLAAAAMLFFVGLAHGHFTGSDEVGVFAMTRSLATRASLDVPPLRHTEVGRHDLRYSYFAVGQSVLALPFYAAGAAADRWLPEAWSRVLGGENIKSGHHRFGGDPRITFACLYSPVISALLVALFFRLQRRLGASVRSAVVAAALLAATSHLATLSTYFLRHTTEALTILAAIYWIHRWRESQDPRQLLWASCFASATLLVRVPAGLAAIPLAGYLGWLLLRPSRPGSERGRLAIEVAAIVGPLCVALLLHGLVNYLKWQSVFSSPMLGQHSRFDTPLATGLAGLLVSPGSSVFLYSPLLLLAPWTIRTMARRHREEAVLVVCMALVFLVVYAKFDGWSGLWSAPGPRYLFIVVPLLLLPLGLWLDDAESARSLRWRAVAVLGVAGLWVQIVSTVVRWGSIPALARYPFLDPDQSGFLFEPDRSPVWVMTGYLLRAAPLDPWWIRLWNGAADDPGRPGLAAAALLVWSLAMAASVRGIVREMRSCAATDA